MSGGNGTVQEYNRYVNVDTTVACDAEFVCRSANIVTATNADELARIDNCFAIYSSSIHRYTTPIVALARCRKFSTPSAIQRTCDKIQN